MVCYASLLSVSACLFCFFLGNVSHMASTLSLNTLAPPPLPERSSTMDTSAAITDNRPPTPALSISGTSTPSSDSPSRPGTPLDSPYVASPVASPRSSFASFPECRTPSIGSHSITSPEVSVTSAYHAYHVTTQPSLVVDNSPPQVSVASTHRPYQVTVIPSLEVSRSTSNGSIVNSMQFSRCAALSISNDS